jgi:hypothetical protein
MVGLKFGCRCHSQNWGRGIHRAVVQVHAKVDRRVTIVKSGRLIPIILRRWALGQFLNSVHNSPRLSAYGFPLSFGVTNQTPQSIGSSGYLPRTISMAK